MYQSLLLDSLRNFVFFFLRICCISNKFYFRKVHYLFLNWKSNCVIKMFPPSSTFYRTQHKILCAKFGDIKTFSSRTGDDSCRLFMYFLIQISLNGTVLWAVMKYLSQILKIHTRTHTHTNKKEKRKRKKGMKEKK